MFLFKLRTEAIRKQKKSNSMQDDPPATNLQILFFVLITSHRKGLLPDAVAICIYDLAIAAFDLLPIMLVVHGY